MATEPSGGKDPKREDTGDFAGVEGEEVQVHVRGERPEGDFLEGGEEGEGEEGEVSSSWFLSRVLVLPIVVWDFG